MSSFPEKLADRFRRFHHRHFLPKAEEYEDLAENGQNPEAMVISCSDSRVDPETIFSAMPGELFVVRNVANLVPPYETGGKFHGVSSAIEFAVLNLRIKHLIIMGIPAAAASRRRSTRARPSRPRRNSSRAGCRCSTNRG
ncbi:MAG: carbonic anhydrase [Hyphomicrobium sp.]